MGMCVQTVKARGNVMCLYLSFSTLFAKAGPLTKLGTPG